MIAFLAPAKNMQPGVLPAGAPGRPRFLEQMGAILEAVKEYQPWQLEQLLKLSPELAWEAFARHQDLNPELPGVPALLAYKGLAYLHLNPQDFTAGDFDFAERSLRIASALYGLLSPKDGIHPDRLEMRCKLTVEGKSLYRFWGDTVYRAAFRSGDAVVNLASREYAQLLLPFVKPADSFITCDFLTPVRGKLKTLPARAKMARGEMARFIVKNRLEDPEELKRFSRDGYRFAEGLSSTSRFAFIQHGEG